MARPRIEVHHTFMVDGKRVGQSVTKVPNRRVAMSIDSLRELRHEDALDEIERQKREGPIKTMPGEDEGIQHPPPEGMGRGPNAHEYQFKMHEMNPDQMLRNREDAERILNDKRMKGRSESDPFGAPDKGRKVPKDYKEPPPVTPKRQQGSGAPARPRAGPPSLRMAMAVDSLREMRHENALNEMERGPVKRMPGDDEDMERGIPEGVSPRGNEYKYRMNDMKPDQYLRNKEDADRILNDKRMRGRSEGDAFGAPDKGRKVPKDYKEPPPVIPKRPQGSGAPPTPRTGPPRQHEASYQAFLDGLKT